MCHESPTISGEGAGAGEDGGGGDDVPVNVQAALPVVLHTVPSPHVHLFVMCVNSATVLSQRRKLTWAQQRPSHAAGRGF